MVTVCRWNDSGSGSPADPNGASAMPDPSIAPIGAPEYQSRNSPPGQPQQTSDALGEVVVSARRQNENALNVPESITAIGAGTIAELDIQTFDDYALKVPNLSFSYGIGGLGYGGSRSIAIRGIGGTAGTTALYIDDTPVPETVDPQVVDIARIEVLKGPQGTLFGQGSLGGNVRLISNQPNFQEDLDKVVMQGGYTNRGASADYRLTMVQNIVLSPDTLALRLVAFGSHDAGYVTRSYPSIDYPGSREEQNNQGELYSYGGSISALLKISDAFSADLRILAQRDDSIGLPTVYAPLPAFVPTSVYTLNRSADVQEGFTDTYFLPSLELKYAGAGWSLISSTSYFGRDTANVEDGTEGDRQLLQQSFGAPASVAVDGDPWSSDVGDARAQEEVRVSFDEVHHLSGVVGTRYAWDRTRTVYSSTAGGLAASGLFPTDLLWYSYGTADTKDASVFGESYYKISQLESTFGLRKYWLEQSADNYANGLLDGGPATTDGLKSSANGINPRFAVSYKPTEETLIYTEAAKGYRQGGPNVPLISLCDLGLQQLGLTSKDLSEYKPDTVWNYEVGGKAQVGQLSVNAAVFQMNWSQIQQALTIPVCYSGVTTNAGAARNRGAEFEMSGVALPGLEVRVGLGYDDDRITKSGYSGQPSGARVFEVPNFTGSVALTYSRPLSARYEGYVSGDDSYTGSSTSIAALSSAGDQLTAPPLVRRPYNVVNARLGVRWDKMELGFYAKNVFNSIANLGDINAISIIYKEPNGLPLPRVALLPPFQLGLMFKYGY